METNHGKTVAVAGHFNPLHIGHIQLINEARKIGDKLIVIVANDDQARLKREAILIPLVERMQIMRSIKGVDEVVASIDKDSTVKETLKLVMPDILASGCSEDHPDAIEEYDICYRLGIKTRWGVGGDKIRSSSEILKSYEENRMSAM